MTLVRAAAQLAAIRTIRGGGDGRCRKLLIRDDRGRDNLPNHGM
jgi:hypothetical protein